MKRTGNFRRAVTIATENFNKTSEAQVVVRNPIRQGFIVLAAKDLRPGTKELYRVEAKEQGQ